MQRQDKVKLKTNYVHFDFFKTVYSSLLSLVRNDKKVAFSNYPPFHVRRKFKNYLRHLPPFSEPQNIFDPPQTHVCSSEFIFKSGTRRHTASKIFQSWMSSNFKIFSVSMWYVDLLKHAQTIKINYLRKVSSLMFPRKPNPLSFVFGK